MGAAAFELLQKHSDIVPEDADARQCPAVQMLGVALICAPQTRRALRSPCRLEEYHLSDVDTAREWYYKYLGSQKLCLNYCLFEYSPGELVESRAALDRIRRNQPELADHLQATVSTAPGAATSRRRACRTSPSELHRPALPGR
jgi:hypothetical protein